MCLPLVTVSLRALWGKQKTGKRGYCFPLKELAPKMKLPFSPWNFVPCSCFFKGLKVQFAQAFHQAS